METPSLSTLLKPEKKLRKNVAVSCSAKPLAMELHTVFPFLEP